MPLAADEEMMKTTNYTFVFRLALAAVVAFAFASCASQPRNESDHVVERAQELRELLIAGELEEAYEYYSPGYRSTHSLIDFGVQERTRRVRYTSVNYQSHECDESRCIVKFDMGYRVATPVPGLSYYDGTSLVEDTWIKTQGEWWYLPKN